MSPPLHEYLNSTILPQYESFTDGHDRAHVETVLRESLCLADPVMPRFFTSAQRTVIAEAIEDHRVSADSPPRSLCGRILADADHFIVPEDILRRTLLYGKTHYPTLTPAEHIARVRAHLQEKFLSGGYLRFWLNDPRSLAGLDALRALAADEPRLRAACEKYL